MQKLPPSARLCTRGRDQPQKRYVLDLTPPHRLMCRSVPLEAHRGENIPHLGGDLTPGSLLGAKFDRADGAPLGVHKEPPRFRLFHALEDRLSDMDRPHFVASKE